MRSVVRRALRKARAWGRPRALILLYHRVADSGSAPKIMVRPEHFGAHVRLALRHARCAALADLPGLLRRPWARRPWVVFTFDDGYLDTGRVALPMLRERGACGTVFVATRFMRTGEEYWWDSLYRRVGDAGIEAAVERVRGLPEAQRRAYLESVGANVGPPIDAACRPMSEGEVAEASRQGLWIGAHTQTHTRLADLPASAVDSELSACRADLRRVLGRDVEHFAYPFGHAGYDYTDATVRAVEGAGFTLACCSAHAVARAGSPPMQLPRLWVDDWDPAEFEERFGQWCRYTQ